MSTTKLSVRSNEWMGWRPDTPDARDHCFSLRSFGRKLMLPKRPRSVDLSGGIGPCYNQKSLGSCHDQETEVLTDSGFRLFSSLNGSEKLATVDPVTSELTYESPTRLTRRHYCGELICSNNESLNFRVTPDHKMLLRKWDERIRTLSSDYSFISADQIGWYCGLMNRVSWKGERSSDTFILNGISHKLKEQRVNAEIPMSAWMMFLGIYLAEGTMLKRDQQKDRISYKIQIAASKEREKHFIRQVLSDIGIKPLELSDRFTFCNKRIYESMSALGLEGIKAKRKFVPRFVFRQSAGNIAYFLSGHFAGDGSEQNGHRAHYTSSARLADDLQTLIFLSGNESRMSARSPRTSILRDGRTIIGREPEYRVSVCARKNLAIERSDCIFKVDYSGEVFCAEVPSHHTLVTRRGGKILISGNCTAHGIAALIEYERRFNKLPRWMPSRLQIYYNERFMEGTVKSDAGAEIRDGIKVVSKLGYAPETMWPYQTSKFRLAPSLTAQREAKKHLVKAYARVPQTQDAMLDCLASNTPFTFGFTVYDYFESDEMALTGKLRMPKSGEGTSGGHAVAAFGYLNEETILVRNSWDTDWGLKGKHAGYFTMPIAYLLDPNLSDDFWCLKIVE